MNSVTLHLQYQDKCHHVEMPSATTIGYAAQRCAFAVGMDAGLDWHLAVADDRWVIPDGELAAKWANQEVILAR